MRAYRQCTKCHKKYDEEEFSPSSSTWCRPCTVFNTKLIMAFDGLLKNPATGFRKLDTYLDTWYLVEV